MSNSKNLWIPLFVVLVLALATLACGPSATPTPISEATQMPATPEEKVTLIPPTLTPVPPTATPFATPTPAILTCEAIEKKRKELTDLQWEAYVQEIVGERIRFRGKVIEVHDDGRIHILAGKGLFTVVMLYEIPLDVAVKINKDQFVEGEGTVRDVGTFLGLTVDINVESLQ